MLILFFLTSQDFVAEKPNILLILVDDAGYADIGAFEKTRKPVPEGCHIFDNDHETNIITAKTTAPLLFRLPRPLCTMLKQSRKDSIKNASKSNKETVLEVVRICFK